MIASVAAGALSLGNLSQTHWVARAAWLYSLVASLAAVYCANNISWKTGYLVLCGGLKPWISNFRGWNALDDLVDDLSSRRVFAAGILASLLPSPASTLTVSAPSVLLSSSLLFLFIGFGIFLGFTWHRGLDTFAGPDDSRDVFILYMVSLALCYVLYAASDSSSHDRPASTTVRDVVARNLMDLQGILERHDARRREHQPETLDRIEMKVLQLMDIQTQKLEQQSEKMDWQSEKLAWIADTRAMLDLSMEHPTYRDSRGRGPLHWAAERGLRFSILRLRNLRVDLNPDSQDDEGMTALMLASSNGHKEVVRELLHGGWAHVDLRNNDGKTASDLSWDKGHMDIYNLISNTP